MLEAKYYKDHRHNYMILRCEREEMVSSYQHKILISDKIGEILRCSVRYINGATYYYYDISSKTTLEGLYRGKQMSYVQVKDVLCQLYGICEKLAGYFMEETKLVLEPEHIYYDMTNNKYIGLYYPDYQVQGADIYRPLMDFLLEHVDTEDARLTENIYQLYEMSEERHFCIEDALGILENREEAVHEADQKMSRVPNWETSREQIIDGPRMYEATEVLQTEMTQADETSCEKPQKKSLFYPVFTVLSLLGIAGALAVCYIYELAQEEKLALYGSIAAMSICLLICLIGIVNGSRKKSTEKKGTEWDVAEELSRKADGEYYADREELSLEHVISRDMNLGMAENEPEVYQATCHNHMASDNMKSNVMQEDVNYGNTVFFDASRVEEYKLYAVDKRNKRHIELRRFPCTVGKMAGCVDYVLSDDSVSRIHARFDKQGEKVLMTDMNSTNGTYKNGLRMQPQETVEIEPGDEIRFGSLNYCYR